MRQLPGTQETGIREQYPEKPSLEEAAVNNQGREPLEEMRTKQDQP